MSCFHIFLLALVAVACSDFVLGYSMPSLNRARAAGAGFRLHGKITPNKGESMDQYRKVVLDTLKSQAPTPGKLGGRELLEMIIRKWGVAYDLQLRKNKPFGDGSENLYINVMWRYFGQKSFPMNEREYLEHLEAIGRYLTAVDKVEDFTDKVKQSRKRPNAYFGYAVGIPLDIDPSTADQFFKDLPYE